MKGKLWLLYRPQSSDPYTLVLPLAWIIQCKPAARVKSVGGWLIMKHCQRPVWWRLDRCALRSQWKGNRFKNLIFGHIGPKYRDIFTKPTKFPTESRVLLWKSAMKIFERSHHSIVLIQQIYTVHGCGERLWRGRIVKAFREGEVMNAYIVLSCGKNAYKTTFMLSDTFHS